MRQMSVILKDTKPNGKIGRKSIPMYKHHKGTKKIVIFHK